MYVGPRNLMLADNQKLTTGPLPFVVIPPGHYCVVQNPIDHTWVYLSSLEACWIVCVVSHLWKMSSVSWNLVILKFDYTRCPLAMNVNTSCVLDVCYRSHFHSSLENPCREHQAMVVLFDMYLVWYHWLSNYNVYSFYCSPGISFSFVIFQITKGRLRNYR